MTCLSRDELYKLGDLARHRFNLVGDGEKIFDGDELCVASVFLADGADDRHGTVHLELLTRNRVRHLVALRGHLLDGLEDGLLQVTVLDRIDGSTEPEGNAQQFETGWDTWGTMEGADWYGYLPS